MSSPRFRGLTLQFSGKHRLLTSADMRVPRQHQKASLHRRPKPPISMSRLPLNEGSRVLVWHHSSRNAGYTTHWTDECVGYNCQEEQSPRIHGKQLEQRYGKKDASSQMGYGSCLFKRAVEQLEDLHPIDRMYLFLRQVTFSYRQSHNWHA